MCQVLSKDAPGRANIVDEHAPRINFHFQYYRELRFYRYYAVWKDRGNHGKQEESEGPENFA